MGITSLQVCMDSADWLQGTIQEAESSGCLMLDSSLSSPSAADMLAACTRPPAAAVAAAALMEGGRRLRPPHDQALKCPRCESTHTKFCYYNNYSLSQPRYFCKTCRRYWTKGGTLRNIPVGGGCRKNKKPSSSSSSSSAKKSTSNCSNDNITLHSHSSYENAQRLSSSPFAHQMNLSHLSSMMGTSGVHEHSNAFMETKYGSNSSLFPQNPRPIDFMDNKFDFMGINSDLGMVNPGFNADNISVNNGLGLNNNNLQGLCPPYGLLSLEVNNGGALMDTNTCQRLMLTYDHPGNDQDQNAADVKPNPKLLSLDWQQDQGCSGSGKDSVPYGGAGGYINGLGSSWNGMINGYGSSTRTNSLI